MTAVINAYLQQSMQDTLVSAADRLRQHGYRGPLLVVQNNGGAAEVWRTTPVATYNGGPVAGLMGSVRLSQLYGGGQVIATDMGGTTFDAGVIADGHLLPYEFRPVIDRRLVGASMIEVRSIGAGGGSIARLNADQGNRLVVGPASAGAMPGPAAYDLGGTDPTVTDADLVLGYLNPDFFAGGRRRLNRERAARVIQERIARPLGIDVIEAAARIRRTVETWRATPCSRRRCNAATTPGSSPSSLTAAPGRPTAATMPGRWSPPASSPSPSRRSSAAGVR